jgi:heme O synthase-like polyprenyltransferase
LPQDREWGNPASVLMLAATITLTIFGMLPAWMGFAGKIYLPVSVLLGMALLGYAFALVRGATTARRVMFVSLIYLPCVLLAMVLDKV